MSDFPMAGRHFKERRPVTFLDASALRLSMSQWTWATISGLLLIVVLPLALAIRNPAPGQTPAAVGAWLVTAWSGLQLTVSFVSSRARPVQSFFYVFVYVFLGMAALAQVCSGIFPLDGRTYPVGIVNHGVLITLLGVVGFEVGRRVPQLSSRPSTNHEDRVRRTVDFSAGRAVALGLIGLFAVAYTLRTHGGLRPFFTSREATSTAIFGNAPIGVKTYLVENKTAGLILQRLTQVPIFLSLYLLIRLRRRGWRAAGSSDLMVKGLMVALVVANIIVNNPIGNSRFWFGLVAIAFASIYIDLRDPIQLRRLTATAVIAFIVVFPALDAFRHSGGPQLHYKGVRADLVGSGSYSAFQEELNGVIYTRLAGHTDGKQLLSAVGTFVPRTVWPGKGSDTGSLVDSKLYNRAASLWTEADVDFGVPGVLILFALYGLAVSRLDRIGVTSPAAVAIVPLAAAAELFVLRGSLQPALGTVYGLVALFVVLLKRSDPEAPDEPQTSPASAARPGESAASTLRPARAR